MVSTEKMRICLGQHVGNYQIRRLLGRGGFAEVYLGTRAALKVLTGPLDEHEAGAFQREARLLAGLIHPHIVRVLDFGLQDATPFLVLDYAPGGTLRQRHPKGEQLPLTTVIEYVSQIASALQSAHNQHLIHRDVKPENILLGRDGQVLLADFGIAILMQSLRSAQTQQIVGTPIYMAPEQLHGHACQASDQYALSILAYEWLCGRPPFVGSPMEIAAQHCFASPPPLKDRIASLPSGVEQVIQRALAKNPLARFPSVNAFAGVLAEASPASALATTKERAFVPRAGSSPALPPQGQPVRSQTQPARPGAAAPAQASRSGGPSPKARTPLASTIPDHRSLGTSSLPVFKGVPVTQPETSHSAFWALGCGGVCGFFSSGVLLLLYKLAAPYGFTNAFVLLAGGVLLLVSLGCLYLAGWLTRKRTGKVTPSWVAGSLAGLLQQVSVGVFAQAPAVSLALPASFPALLLLWGVLGGVLGLLAARRRRR
jgi:serine/threonine protein kinase